MATTLRRAAQYVRMSTEHQKYSTENQAEAIAQYSPARDYRFIEINRSLRAMHAPIVASTIRGIEAAGGLAEPDAETDLVLVNREFTASIVIARSFTLSGGGLRWKIRLDTGLHPDISIAVRMDASNKAVRDYYLLPWIDIGSAGKVKLAEDNGSLLDAYRFDDLEPIFYLSSRHWLRVAA